MGSLRGNPWAVLTTLALGFFMTLLDLTIVNIALPRMIDDLGTSLDQALWVVNAYALALATLLITAGRLGDIRGPRVLFTAGVVVFTLASLACGLSQNGPELIAARAVQGVGAALLVPQTITLIIATFPADRRGTALGVWGAVGGLATIVGPTLGGFLVDQLNWRWIFLVNVPVGAIVVFMIFTTLPNLKPARSHRFDFVGVILVTAALFCITYALNEGERYDWSTAIWLTLAAGLVLLGIFVAQQRTRQATEPLVPFALFKDRNFTIMTIIAAVISLAVIGLMLPINLYLQSGLGMTPLHAGLVTAPASAIGLVVGPIAGRLSDKIGGKWLLIFGLLMFAAGLLFTALVAGSDTRWYAFMPPMAVIGIGTGCLLAPMAAEAMRNVPPQLAGAASGVNNTVRQIGSVIGAAAIGALIQSQLADNLGTEAGKRAAELPQADQGPFLDGFRAAAQGGVRAGGDRADAVHSVVANLPGDIVGRATHLAEQVFGRTFTDTMRSAFVLPIVLLVISAVVCLAVRGRRVARKPASPEPEPEPALR